MTFNTWLDTFVSEKGIDLNDMFEIETAENTHFIDYAQIVAWAKLAPASEQAEIKTQIVKIDFVNGDVLHFFRYLGELAILEYEKS